MSLHRMPRTARSSRIPDEVAGVAKALAGGVVAFLGAGATAAADERITTGEWWAMAAAGVAAAYAVWQIPNRDDAPAV